MTKETNSFGKAQPYKILLKHLEANPDMGFDRDHNLHYLLIGTDFNDSKNLIKDINEEMKKATGVYMDIAGQYDLYMYFETNKDIVAKVLKYHVISWLKHKVASLEEPLEWGSESVPGWCNKKAKDVIEAAAADGAADGAAMDAAESLLDREQMRKEIMGQVTDFTSAIRHLYKALDAGYAKDEEIAALKRKIDYLNQEAIINTLQYKTEPKPDEVQSRTRTAADAQHGDLIWYKHGTTGQIEYDHIDTVGNGHIIMIPNAVLIEDFGTKWGFIEEEAK